MQRRRRSREYWERLVAEFESSDESAPSFADSHQVHVATLRSWLYRIRRECEESYDPATAFVEVIQVAEQSDRIRSNGVRLDLPGGAEVYLDKLPPPSYLAELCRELSE
jgi:transposase-like protein